MATQHPPLSSLSGAQRANLYVTTVYGVHPAAARVGVRRLRVRERGLLVPERRHAFDARGGEGAFFCGEPGARLGEVWVEEVDEHCAQTRGQAFEDEEPAPGAQACGTIEPARYAGRDEARKGPRDVEADVQDVGA